MLLSIHRPDELIVQLLFPLPAPGPPLLSHPLFEQQKEIALNTPIASYPGGLRQMSRSRTTFI